MTEQDILRRQEINGQREYYLMLMGQFYHAYGHGAFALSRATGYRVMRKQRRGGEVLTVGFPINCLERVQTRIQENKGQIRQLDEKTFLFSGIDGTPDLSLVQEPQKTAAIQTDGDENVSAREGYAPAACDGCLQELLAFNLSSATPIDAMNFLNQMQLKYGTK